MYGLTLLQVILAPHAAAVAPPPPVVPAPIVRPVAADPTTTLPIVVTPAQPQGVTSKAPVLPSTTTTTIVTSVNVECVVVLNGMTFSPSPADSSGSCAAVSAQYPTATSVTPTQEQVTTNAG